MAILYWCNLDVSGCASPTKGLFVGGFAPSITSNIDYVTISTQGNAADFGDLTTATRSNEPLYQILFEEFLGGGTTPSNTNTIDYITIATLGNAIDFGDLTVAAYAASGVASPTRAVFGPG